MIFQLADIFSKPWHTALNASKQAVSKTLNLLLFTEKDLLQFRRTKANL